MQPGENEILMKMYEKKDINGLIDIIFNDPDFKNHLVAFNLIMKIGDPIIVPYMICILEDESKDLKDRNAAAVCLGSFDDLRAVEPLTKVLNHPDDDFRTEVVLSLMEIGDHRAVEPLIERLNDSVELIRVSAAEALIKIGDEKAIKPIKKFLENDVSIPDYHGDPKDAKEYLVNFLLELKSENQLASSLIKFYNNESKNSDTVSSKITEYVKANLKKENNILMEMYKAKDINGLVDIVSEDPDFDNHHLAAELIMASGDPVVVPPMIHILEDESKGVKNRATAALTLGFFADSRAVEPLINVLNHPDEDFRNEVIISLESIGDHRAVEPLIERLNDQVGYIRYSAAEALIEIGDERALEPIKNLLTSKDTFSYEHDGVQYSKASLINHIEYSESENKLFSELIKLDFENM